MDQQQLTPALADPSPSVVRVLSRGGEAAAGVGFVVGDRHVLTCAHVVNSALGRDLREASEPGRTVLVEVDFPLLGDQDGAPRRRARLAVWRPPPRADAAGGEDVAGLVLVDEALPAGSGACRLADAGEAAGGAVEVFGFPARPARSAGAWTRCRLMRRVGGRLVQLDQDSESALGVQPGYSGSPLWDPARGAAVGMLAIAGRDSSVRDAYGIPADVLASVWPDVLQPVPPCPYAGLAALGEAHSAVFVGREEETRTLLAAVESHPVVAVVGPSGVGKSSLTGAGLIPELRRRGWAVATFRPSGRPFESLAAALLWLELDGRADPRVDDIRRRADELADRGLTGLAGAISLARGGRRILIVADQFEEVFGDDVQPAVRDRFLDTVLPPPPGPSAAAAVRLVLTIRADFFPVLLAHRDAGPRLQGRDVLLSPMSEATLRRVIREPARLHGVTYSRGLVEQMAADAGGGSGALPLLAFALTEMWGMQRGRTLTHAEYDAIGAVRGALNRHAEQVAGRLLDGFSDTQLRDVLLAMVHTGPADTPVTRRPARRSELDPADWRLAQRLAEGRIAVVDSDGGGTETVELAHDALITDWSRLRQIVDEDLAYLRWRSHVEQLLAAGDPLPETRIAEAEAWLGRRGGRVPPAVTDLVRAARRRRDRRVRRLRAVAAALAVLLVAVSLLGAVAWQQRRQALDSADLATSRYLLGVAQEARDRDAALATRLVLAASVLSPEARGAAIEEALRYPDATAVLSAGADVTGLAVSGDGTTIAIRTGESVSLWDVARRSRTVEIAVPDALADLDSPTVTFSPDGQTLFVQVTGRGVLLFDVADGDRRGSLPGPPDSGLAQGVVLSEDGRFVAEMTGDYSPDETAMSTVRLWNVAERRKVAEVTQAGGRILTAFALAFSPDGSTIVMPRGQGVGVFRIPDLSLVRDLRVAAGDSEPVTRLAFLPGGHLLASDDYGGASVVRPATGAMVALPGDHSLEAGGPSGSTFVTEGPGYLWLWDSHTMRAVRSVKAVSGYVRSTALSRDGRTLAVFNGGRTVAVVDTRAPGAAVPQPPDAAYVVAPDGQTVAVESGDGTVGLWRLGEDRLEPLASTAGDVNDLVFSHDGSLLAAAMDDGTVVVWDVGTGGELVKATAHRPECQKAGFCKKGASSATFARDDDTLYSIGSDGRFVEYDLTRRRVADTAVLGHRDLQAVFTGPDEDTLFYLSSDWRFFRGDTGGGRLQQLRTPDPDRLSGVDAAQDWRLFAFTTTRSPTTVELWDMRRQVRLRTLEVGDPGTSLSWVSLTHDGHTLAAIQHGPGSSGAKIILWDLEADRRRAAFEVDDAFAAMFLPGGKSLLADSVGELRVWGLDPTAVTRRLCTLGGGDLTESERSEFMPDHPYQPACA
jgi:WD40 repeat protein